MNCSCDLSPIRFAVPPELRACSPAGAEAAAICPRCLTVESTEAEFDDLGPDFSRVSDAFPDGDAGVALALALGLLESLATNRRAIETALERVEAAGADPLLAIDRLLADPSVAPAVDLERRRDQLESMLY